MSEARIDNEGHWNWIRGLIAEAEAPQTAPAPVAAPRPRPVDASRGTAGQFVADTNVISARLLDDGMASITLRQSVGW